MVRPPVAVILGPTAVGKTTLALAAAQALQAHILGADSLQIYRDMDIGTAKPTAPERGLVPHHLIDVVAPDEPMDAARYAVLGREILTDLHARKIPPLVVGGTGLYIKALLYGLFADGVRETHTRRWLQQDLEAQGAAALHARLSSLDPQAAARIHPGDAFRLVRALEVIDATGRPLSELHQSHGFQDCPYRILKIGLTLERSRLYELIEARVDHMLAQGLVAEVERLLARYGPSPKPFQSLGYRQIITYLQGRLSWEEAVADIKTATRRYAKRQLTWFRADPEIIWLEPHQIEAALDLLRQFFALNHPDPT